MLKAKFAILALLCVLAACVQLPPTPEDLKAKKFESVPGKAVLYLVRTYPDLGDVPTAVLLDDQMMGTTYPGTYFRWELPAGRHRIAGYAGDSGFIVVDLSPDRMYFVQQVVHSGGWRPFPYSFFRVISEAHGRAVVLNGTLVGALMNTR